MLEVPPTPESESVRVLRKEGWVYDRTNGGPTTFVQPRMEFDLE
jgi:hypothetical protein